MMTFDSVWQLVADSAPDSPIVREFRAATHPKSGSKKFGPGQRRADETLANFRVRQHASRLAGLDEVGLDQTIENLESLPREEPILLFHWSAASTLFTALVCDRTQALVGIVRAHSRTALDW
ncbi:MAG TPA: hypothetical protein VER11_10740 [Polyangiaceae bacterium]|nr:hypothetical protein [Polyangiaceae bacterium]